MSILGAGTGDAFGYSGNDGYLAISRDFDGAALYLNKTNGQGGTHIQFRADGTSVGSIGVTGTNDIEIHSTASNHTGLRLGEGYYIPTNNSGASADNAVDLGLPSVRYKDLYLSGGVVFGDAGGSTTSTSNSLDSYEEGTWTPVGQNINGSGYNVEVAQYTKVGRLVSCDLRVQWTGSANTTGSIAFSLPFQSQNTTGASRTGLVFYQGTQVFGNAAISTHIANNSSNVSFYKTNGGSFQAVSSNQVNGSYNWLVSFSYFTA